MIKKIFSIFIFAFVLCFGYNSSAMSGTTLLVPAEKTAPKGDLIGMYITPRFTMNFNHFDPKSNDKHQTSDFTSNPGLGIAVGYDFSKNYDIPVRAELEYLNTSFGENFNKSFGQYKFKKFDQYLLANVIWDIHNFQIDEAGDYVLTPFAGVGLGVDFVKSEFKSPTKKNQQYDQLFAWDAQAGVSLGLYDRHHIDLGYKFIQTGAINCGQYESNHNYSHNIQLGYRFDF